MTLDYSVKGQVKVDMTDYVKSMVEDFNDIEDLSEVRKTPQPWSEKLFCVNASSPPLDNDKAKQFHTMVAKGLLCLHRDIQVAFETG